MLESSFYFDAFSQTGFIPIINGRSQEKKSVNVFIWSKSLSFTNIDYSV